MIWRDPIVYVVTNNLNFSLVTLLLPGHRRRRENRGQRLCFHLTWPPITKRPSMSFWTAQAGFSFHLTSQQERLLVEHLGLAPTVLGPVPALAHLSAAHVLSSVLLYINKTIQTGESGWAKRELMGPSGSVVLGMPGDCVCLINSAPLSAWITQGTTWLVWQS